MKCRLLPIVRTGLRTGGKYPRRDGYTGSDHPPLRSYLLQQIQNARKIIEITIGILKAQGTVSDAVTGKLIPSAILTFRLKGSTDVVLEKETAAKGGFMIKSLDDAIYYMTI